jgi:hypothetical protein
VNQDQEGSGHDVSRSTQVQEQLLQAMVALPWPPAANSRFVFLLSWLI